MTDSKEVFATARATSVDLGRNDYRAASPTHAFEHGVAEVAGDDQQPVHDAADMPEHKKSWRQKFRYFRTVDFWIILGLGQFLAICTYERTHL